MMLRTLTFVLALSCALIQADHARAEADTLRVAKQFGIAYMQFMVMEDQKMIEKHAKAAGLGDVKVEFNSFRSSDVMNDALLSGSVDFVCLGIPGIITIWSKTKGMPIEVRAASGLNVSPLILLSRDPNIKSIKDFKDGHKIAMPAVKVSIQAIMLQMAAANSARTNSPRSIISPCRWRIPMRPRPCSAARARSSPIGPRRRSSTGR
jgi:NitT/TauT family transport system substrate-binding protein